MRQLLIVTFTISILASLGVAQEKNAIPLRYQSIAKDGRLQLKRILGSPEMHVTFNPSMAFTPDGKRAIYVEDLTTGSEDKPSFRARVLVWDVDTKIWPSEFEIAGKSVTCVALAMDGKKVLLGGETKGETEKHPHAYFGVWDLENGKELRSIVTTERNVLSVALSGEQTALVGTSEGMKAWDLKTGKPTITFVRNDKVPVTALTLLPGGKQFLAGDYNGETQIFDVDKAKPMRDYKAKFTDLLTMQVSISKGGSRFVSALQRWKPPGPAVAGQVESAIALWDIGGKEIGAIRVDGKELENVVSSVCLSDDGKTVFVVLGKPQAEADDFACAKIMAWDAEANKALWTHAVPYRGRVPMLVQGDKLLVGGGPNRFDVWSIKSGKLEQSWGGHKGPVTALGVLQNGDILSAGLEGEIITWRGGKIASNTPAHKGAITVMSVQKDRKDWLTAGADLTIRVWPQTKDRKTEFLKAHAGPITSLAFGDGKIAFSGSGDRTVKSWNLGGGPELASFAGHSEGVNTIAISPDNRWLASGSDDTTIKLWPIKEGKLDPDRDPITLEKHKKAVTCLAFTRDGKRLLSGSQDQKLMVWDWQKGSTDFMIAGHKNWITSILQIDDKTVLTTSDDLTVCAWDLSTGKETARVDFGGVGDCPRCLAQVGPDRILVGTSSWLIYEFQLVPDAKSKQGGKSSNK